MAAYEESNGLGVGGLFFNIAPFIAASHYQGTEAKMIRGSSGLTARAMGRTSAHGLTRSYLSGSSKLSSGFATKGALTIAKTHGVFRASAWGAAGRAGVTGQMAKIAASRMAGMFMTGFNISIFAPLLYSGVKGAVNTLREIGRDTRGLDFGGNYIDSRGAYTERQRSIRAITSSRLSTRAKIGNEALLLHR